MKPEEIQELEAKLAIAKEANEKQQALKARREFLQERTAHFKQFANLEGEKGHTKAMEKYLLLAQEAEAEAKMIILDGEELVQESTEKAFIPSVHFGKGSAWKFFTFGRVLTIICTIILLFFGSMAVQFLTRQISVSVFSNVIHFVETVVYYNLMWIVIDYLIFKKYRAIYDFFNTQEFPQYDFTSKCLDSENPQFYALALYFIKALAFVLMFMHSSITNGG